MFLIVNVMKLVIASKKIMIKMWSLKKIQNQKSKHLKCVSYKVNDHIDVTMNFDENFQVHFQKLKIVY